MNPPSAPASSIMTAGTPPGIGSGDSYPSLPISPCGGERRRAATVASGCRLASLRQEPPSAVRLRLQFQSMQKQP